MNYNETSSDRDYMAGHSGAGIVHDIAKYVTDDAGEFSTNVNSWAHPVYTAITALFRTENPCLVLACLVMQIQWIPQQRIFMHPAL